jgi:hypothetical protein
LGYAQSVKIPIESKQGVKSSGHRAREFFARFRDQQRLIAPDLQFICEHFAMTAGKTLGSEIALCFIRQLEGPAPEISTSRSPLINGYAGIGVFIDTIESVKER